MKVSRSVIIGACVVLGVLVVGYVASPWLAFQALSAAARKGDRDAIERLVDFPHVRSSLKDQISAGVIAEMKTDPKTSQNPFAALGVALIPMIADRIIDAAITPDGIAQMIKTGQANPADGAAAPADTRKPDIKLAYQDLDHFKASLISVDQPKAPVDFVMERHGLFSWRLERVQLPMDELSKSLAQPPDSGSTDQPAQ